MSMFDRAGLLARARGSSASMRRRVILPIIKRSSFGGTYWQQTSDPKDDK
ncbi:hypothetical protein J2W39_002467 [Variovorax paradoxus]|uniref:Uncharacterized protein n=1 Tax=Variovorax paradoxus TaxID=34073 RepID=A0AAW8EEL2_VARPD|nr:hypothetical protein [Variovorax paradoxus]MDP9971233.1 hypothetical protein [Variovorax paradoxus]